MKRWLAALVCLALLALPACALPEEGYETLARGDKGEAVLALKQRMYELGYYASDKASDGFNATMVERLHALQKVNGLELTDVATAKLQAFIFSDACLPYANMEDRVGNMDAVVKPSIDLPAVDAPLTADGFLAEAGGEYVYANAEEGLWHYVSDRIIIRVTRYQEELTPLCWFESEIWLKDATDLRACLTARKGNTYARERAVDIARENRLVWAVNDDYFGTRVAKGWKVGTVIRNGDILSDSTYAADKGKWPNLETLALYPNGLMEAGKSDAYTAQEYAARGAWQVFAFGPVLVTGGEIGEHIDESYYYYREPRTALGMIEAGHYVAITVEGRVDRSKGVRLPWLANRMLDLGVTEALNLDGGGTVSLIFMGETLNESESHTKSGDNSRGMTGLIGVGTSQQVQP